MAKNYPSKKRFFRFAFLALLIVSLGSFTFLMTVDGIAQEQWTCKSWPTENIKFVCDDIENKCFALSLELAQKNKVTMQCEQTDWQARLRSNVVELYAKFDMALSR
jgi:hypothetical protein